MHLYIHTYIQISISLPSIDSPKLPYSLSASSSTPFAFSAVKPHRKNIPSRNCILRLHCLRRRWKLVEEEQRRKLDEDLRKPSLDLPRRKLQRRSLATKSGDGNLWICGINGGDDEEETAVEEKLYSPAGLKGGEAVGGRRGGGEVNGGGERALMARD